VEPAAPGSTDHRSSKHGSSKQGGEAGQSKIVVVDLGAPQSPLRVDSLRQGDGTLIKRIEGIVDDLVQDGTLKSGAQTVVVVVREFAPFPFGAFGGEDDEEDDD
jgi:hypothetical protein